MADYVLREVAGLAAQPVPRLMAGQIVFGPPPTTDLAELRADTGPGED
jgi:hypothetical protein